MSIFASVAAAQTLKKKLEAEEQETKSHSSNADQKEQESEESKNDIPLICNSGNKKNG